MRHKRNVNAVPIDTSSTKWLARIFALQSENPVAKLRGMARCIVSYLDTEGLRHIVEVEAESLYEAGVLALKAFKQHSCEPGVLSMLEVEIQTSIKHTVTPKKIHSWLNGGARTPKEAADKKRLRELL